MEIPTLLYVVLFVIVGVLFLFLTVKSCYKICPSDQLMIVNGAGSGQKKDAADDTGGARIYQGGGAFIIPGFQSYSFITLAPMSSSIPLDSVLTANNILVDVPIQITFAVDTESLPVMRKAVKYFSSFTVSQIEQAVSEVIVGAMRSVITSLTVEELIADRDKFYRMVDETLSVELAKMGLKVINRNIRDIKDHNKYISSLGRKASEEVVQRANIDVAEQNRMGKIGVAEREATTNIMVAKAEAETRVQIADITRDADIRNAQAQAEREIAQAQAERDRQIGVSRSKSEQQVGAAAAEREAQIKLAELEAQAEESSCQANIRTAAARKESAVAAIQAKTAVAEAQYENTLATKSVDTKADVEIQRQTAIIQARGVAEQLEIQAKAEAEATRVRYQAEADGIKSILEAKSEGLKQLIVSTGSAQAAVQLLMVDKFDNIAKIQAEAISNLKIDNITLVGGGNDNGKMIGSLVQDLVTSLPAAHAIASAAGIDLPSFMGSTGEKTVNPESVPVNG